MVENAQIFQQVLMSDEQVLKVFKPHKGRFWASRFLGHLPGLLSFMVFGLIVAIMLLVSDAPPEAFIMVLLFLGIFLILPILFFGIELLAGVLWYKNRWYCYTNKRVIIQCGIIGRNYRFLDLNQNMNTFVRISVLDRLVRKNTGSIKFWTMMNPGMNFGGGGGWGAGTRGGMGTSPGFSGSMFYFMYVQNPHEILREIQEQVQNNQNQQVNLLQQIAQNTNMNMGNMNNNQGFNQNNNMNNQGFNQNNQNQNWNNNQNNNNQNWTNDNNNPNNNNNNW